jgi:hypothetical protein
VAAAVVLLVTTAPHLASAFSPSSSQRISTCCSSDITQTRRLGSGNRQDHGRLRARFPRPDISLNIKSPWRTAADAEEKTATATTAASEDGGDSSPANSLLRFFDGTSSDNDDDTQIRNGQLDDNNKKGPLGFLKRDVSPLAMDDEWAFSLKSADSESASPSSSQMQKSGGGNDDSAGGDVAIMAGAGIIVATAVVAVTALGLGVVDNFR